MIVDATSVQKYNMARAEFEMPMRQIGELRSESEIPWGAAGRAREYASVNVEGTTVNFSEKNLRKDPLLLTQGESEDIRAVAGKLHRFLGNSIRKVLASAAHSHYGGEQQTLEPTHEEDRQYHAVRYGDGGNRAVTFFRNKGEAGRYYRTSKK